MSINISASKRSLLQHPNRKPHNWLIYQIVAKNLALNEQFFSGIVYDLGAGDAPYLQYFRDVAQDYITVDWEHSSHKQQPEIVADLNEVLPIATASADTVLSISVLEHLSEPESMLREAFRILRPGGRLILQSPWQWKTHEAPYDYFRYSSFGLLHLLRKSGYVDICIDAQSGFFTTWLLKFNYFTMRACRGKSIMSRFIYFFLIPIWYINQWIAPFLDKFDSNWNAETSGFFVTAHKP